ncbi:hypothetical protein FKM82_003976 [Ascaphus truei]
MAGNTNLIVLSVLLVGLVYLIGVSEVLASGDGYDCCKNYSKKPKRMWRIKGFIVQNSSEVCDIDAVIFEIKNKIRVCADPKESWVIKSLNRFKRLKMLSPTKPLRKQQKQRKQRRQRKI